MLNWFFIYFSSTNWQTRFSNECLQIIHIWVTNLQLRRRKTVTSSTPVWCRPCWENKTPGHKTSRTLSIVKYWILLLLSMQMQGCKEIPRQSLLHCFGRNIAEMLLLLKKLFIFIFESWICISSLLAADNNSSVFNLYENFFVLANPHIPFIQAGSPTKAI